MSTHGNDPKLERLVADMSVAQMPAPRRSLGGLLRGNAEKPINKDLKFDSKAYQNKSRTVDLHLWSQPNPKAISSKKTLAEMMTLGYVMEELSKVEIVPIVTSANPLQKKQMVKVPFGPMLDNHFQPALPRKRFKASFVYNQFRLKKSMDYNDPWLTNICLANALVLRLQEKNGLPFNLSIQNGLSPIGELLRINAHQERLGFYFYGSGGNPSFPDLFHLMLKQGKRLPRWLWKVLPLKVLRP
jgi:hypothetical protein